MRFTKNGNSFLICSKCRKNVFNVNFFTENGNTTSFAKCLNCGEAVDFGWVSGERGYV